VRLLFDCRENFNILLYGYGSKEPILQKFRSFLNDEFMIVDVNGLVPKLNPRKVRILDCLSKNGVCTNLDIKRSF